jgi:nucleotide-binding universal stress UspA family protein
MTQLRRILCATDFSPASAPAWSFAQRLAPAAKAELVLVHVVASMPVPTIEGSRIDVQGYQRLTEEERRKALAELERSRDAAADHGLSVAVHVEDGPTAPAILAVADRMKADLLVVGTHGRTGLTRFLVGSVAEHLVQLSTRPVITVRPLPAQGALVQRPIRRILYPTDFSPIGRLGWPWVRTIAKATGAEVNLLHVLREELPDPDIDPAFHALVKDAIREEAWTRAHSFLNTVGFPRRQIHVDFVHGVESDEIVRAAVEREADLIVMGTHGRTGLVRLALGSVARRVLHAAPCPVLAVGPPTGR